MKMQTIHLSKKGGFVALLIERLVVEGFHGVLQVAVGQGDILGARLTDFATGEPRRIEIPLDDIEERASDVH